MLPPKLPAEDTDETVYPCAYHDRVAITHDGVRYLCEECSIGSIERVLHRFHVLVQQAHDKHSTEGRFCDS